MAFLSKKRYFLSLLVVVACFISNIATAQPGDPGSDPDIPVDGGVGLLVVAGVGYGIKRYKNHRQKKNSANNL